MRRTSRWLAAAAVHTTVLAAIGWWGGSPAAAWTVGSMVTGQLLESAVAPDRTDTADRSAYLIGGLILAVVVASLGWPGDPWPPGALITAGGFLLRAWAIRTLGSQFLDGVALLPSHRRVRRGPYQWLRHPGALGTFLVTAGATVTQGSALAGALLVFGLAPALGWRTDREDRLLQSLPP